MSQGNGERKQVCLVMPSAYGTMTMRAGIGFLCRASTHERLRVRVHSLASSAVLANMNQLLCWVLNLVKEGEKVDYFAMQHEDIEPDDWWLDTMVDELERLNLDVLSAVSPIKDPRGLSSTAVGYPDLEDRFRVQYRLTMREVFDLPETFTAADLKRESGPLLVNNGLMVVRFDPRWAAPGPYAGPCFSIRSKIIWDSRVGVFTTDFEPEDWAISRQFAALGLKVGCTRKVKLGHRGAVVFGTGEAWGEDTIDKDNRPEPALTGA